MLRELRPAILMMLVMTVLTGLVYPLAMTGIAQAVFPGRAHGSLIVRDGRVIGSRLIGQQFAGPGYFHPRPSYAGKGYDAASSNGSNLGPTSRDLVSAVRARAQEIARTYGVARVPADLVTASASGLDPDISPASARLQVARVAAARKLTVAQVGALVDAHVRGRTFGILGEPRVNVLELNLALDGLATTH